MAVAIFTCYLLSVVFLTQMPSSFAQVRLIAHLEQYQRQMKRKSIGARRDRAEGSRSHHTQRFSKSSINARIEQKLRKAMMPTTDRCEATNMPLSPTWHSRESTPSSLL